MVRKLKTEIRDPGALWQEIRRLIDIHYKTAPPEITPFMKAFPEVYHLYIRLGLESEEVAELANKLREVKLG